MRIRIQRIAMMGFLIAAAVTGWACFPPPAGVACGDGWCPEGFFCRQVSLQQSCVRSDGCSNGFHDVDEECDDGNDTDGDGCDSNCTMTNCRNGVVTAGESCDDGNDTDNDGCDRNCTVSLLVYVKASNTGVYDLFGGSIALSDDGSTLAVGAYGENSAATGIGGDQASNSAVDSGAVYVFTRSGTTWTQQAYIKASNTGVSDRFGWSVALSDDGSTLAVGASWEDSSATGIDGDPTNNSALYAGAVYVFTRSGTTWTQQAYIKASNTGGHDEFGDSVALSADGSTLVVGAPYEDSAVTGIGDTPADNAAVDAGAVYAFTRSGTSWTQQAYIKASHIGAGDAFGANVALSAEGSTLAVGAPYEGSAATGVGGNPADDTATHAGAVYVFTRSGTTWTQQEYIKASNTGENDQFGWRVALSADGSTLAVGADREDSAARGIDGSPDDNSATDAGAVYVFTRSGTTWTQQAYIKASNTDAGDIFGDSVALSADGSTLAVGAQRENSTATGIDGSQGDNSAFDAGAAYVFTRSGTMWAQQAYLKASNTGAFDRFGFGVALSEDGSTLAAGAPDEGSEATGIGGDQTNNKAKEAGAVYVFRRNAGLP